jgi:DNA-binding MarR family transcriptional regulator
VQAQLSDMEKAAYTALMRVVFAVPRVVSADIALEGGIGLSDHLALQNLADAPGRRMRMTELAVACGVSGSGITRILERLDQAGLTTRVRSRLDARGSVAVLTPAGAARLEQSQAAHVASIRRHILDHLSGLDLAAFACGMEGVAESALSASADLQRRPVTRGALGVDALSSGR